MSGRMKYKKHVRWDERPTGTRTAGECPNCLWSGPKKDFAAHWKEKHGSNQRNGALLDTAQNWKGRHT